MQRLCNEVYVLFYKWIQLEIRFNVQEIKLMFELLLKGDKRFVRYCPQNIENDIFELEKILIQVNDNQKKMLYSFILSCVDLYVYDSIKDHKKILQMDILYYRSVLSQYFVVNYLDNNLNVANFKSFKEEMFQIGAIIKQFYETSEEEKRNIISNMIHSKITELFNRYNFIYSLPPCCL